MIHALYTQAQTLATPRRIWLLFGCFVVVMVLIVGKPFGVAQLKSLSGGVGMLDMQIGYSPREAYALFEALGKEGRTFYLRSLVPLDVAYPLVYTLFFLSAITFLLQKLFAENNSWRMLSLLTVFAGLFDYLENVCVLRMLLSYPQRVSVIAGLANIFTLVKFGGIFLNISLLLAGLLGLASGWYSDHS